MSNSLAILGGLDNYMNLSGALSFFDSWVTSTVIQYWNDATYAPIYWVYYGIVAQIVAAFVAAAYVTVQTIKGAYPQLSTTGTATIGGYTPGADDGYYFKYAGNSAAGDALGWWQLGATLLWEGWALGVVLVGLYAASAVWSLVDARLQEAAANSIGVETPLSMFLAIKVFTLLMVGSLSVLIAGYSLGQIIPLIEFWFLAYSGTPIKTEACLKDEPSKCFTDGTGFEYDNLYHSITSGYAWFQLAAIAAGGYYFMYQFIGLDDGFACDLQENSVSAATYAAIGPILAAQSDRASCLETIQQVFDIEDLDNDGKITRCEDATLQRAFGATPDYALKFSSAFTRASFNKICYENFKQ